MTWYYKSYQDATEKLLLFINELSKVLGHNNNIQRSVSFPYTNNELSERGIKETIQFITISNRIKYLGINLSKGWKPILENFKTLTKETGDDTKK